MTPAERGLLEAAAADAARHTEQIVPEGWGFVDTIDRRDFMRLTAAGLLVTLAVKPAGGMPRPVWNPAKLQQRSSTTPSTRRPS